MHTGKHYTLREVLYWTRREIFGLLVLGTIPTVLYEVWDIKLTHSLASDCLDRYSRRLHCGI